MGSGSLNAMAVFEASYKEDMTQQEAESLVARAIRSGAHVQLPALSDLQRSTFGSVSIAHSLALLSDLTSQHCL